MYKSSSLSNPLGSSMVLLLLLLLSETSGNSLGREEFEFPIDSFLFLRTMSATKPKIPKKEAEPTMAVVTAIANTVVLLLLLLSLSVCEVEVDVAVAVAAIEVVEARIGLGYFAKSKEGSDGVLIIKKNLKKKKLKN